MTRTYRCWSIAVADGANAGLLTEHADDGTRDQKPLLFRSRKKARQWIANNRGKSVDPFGVYAEAVRVEVTVVVLKATPEATA